MLSAVEASLAAALVDGTSRHLQRWLRLPDHVDAAWEVLVQYFQSDEVFPADQYLVVNAEAVAHDRVDADDGA